MRKGAGIIAVALLVVTAACGGGGGDEKARKSEPTTTVAQRNQEPTTTVAQRNQEFALGERAQFTSGASAAVYATSNLWLPLVRSPQMLRIRPDTCGRRRILSSARRARKG
jgi:hypothetical protein